MTESLQVESNPLIENKILLLLHRYQLMPQFLQGIIIDQAITKFSCTDQERQVAIEEFYQQHQFSSPQVQQAWAVSQGFTQEQIEEMALRPVLIEKFKQATWKPQVESYFVNCRSRFDQVIYSLIRTQDYGLAQEVYFRIQEKEQSFSELARQYSTGVEAYTGGVSGPVLLSKLHPVIAKILSLSQLQHVWLPIRIEEWFLIIRLEKFLKAQLDESMQRYLIDEMFGNWLQQQMQQVDSLQRTIRPHESAIH
jgi:parvulin-like peptidyl-prolyl isomerase